MTNEELKVAVEKIWPGTVVVIYGEDHRYKQKIEVSSDYEFTITFKELMALATVLGTTDYETDVEVERGEHRWSTYTVDSWSKYTHTFRVPHDE